MSSDASSAWEGQDLAKAKRALISVTSFLGLLTIFYAAFTFYADSWQITSAGLSRPNCSCCLAVVTPLARSSGSFSGGRKIR